MLPTSRLLLKRLVIDLAVLCSNPEDLDHVCDLLTASDQTDVARAACERPKANLQSSR
jgi:hypothetical protein